MTTPEAFRRRQRVEGVFLVILGLFIAAQAIYFNSEDRDQRRCYEEKFSQLSVALSARSDLQEREGKLNKTETSQNKALWLIYADAAGLVKDDPTQELKPKDQERLQRKLVSQLLEYKDVIGTVEKKRDKINQERKGNPVPPYPVGVCD